jgi:hypothetical protein
MSMSEVDTLTQTWYAILPWEWAFAMNPMVFRHTTLCTDSGEALVNLTLNWRQDPSRPQPCCLICEVFQPHAWTTYLCSVVVSDLPRTDVELHNVDVPLH